jgi:hypothetical protein
MGLFSDILEAINDRGPLEPRSALIDAIPRPPAVTSAPRPVTFACPSCYRVYSTEQARDLHLIDHHAAGTFYVRANDQVIPDLIFLEEPCTDLRVFALGQVPVTVRANGPANGTIGLQVPPGGSAQFADALGLAGRKPARGRVTLHVSTPMRQRQYDIYIAEPPSLDVTDLDFLVSGAQAPLLVGQAPKWHVLSAAANEGRRDSLARRYLRGFAEYLHGYVCEGEQDFGGARRAFERAFGLLRPFSSTMARDARSVLAFKMNAFGLLRQAGPRSVFWQAANFFDFPMTPTVVGRLRTSSEHGVWLDEFQEGILRAVAHFYVGEYDRVDAELRELPTALMSEGNNDLKMTVMEARVAQRLGQEDRSQRAYRRLEHDPIFDAEARSVRA